MEDFYLFASHFDIQNLPAWKCPNCPRGHLVPAKNQLKVTEAPRSIMFHDFPEYEQGWDYGTFSSNLICNAQECNELIIVSGDATKSIEYPAINPDDENDIVFEYEWELTPRYFSEPIRVFSLEGYPHPVNAILIKAFGLMWYDAPSCANRIRSVVEKILDLKKVKKFSTRNGKRNTIALHHRIVEFKKINKEVGHLFEAVKWIGNAGSHSDDKKIKREDLLTAFLMLEHALDKLYNTESHRLKKIATAINKSKGPVKKKTLAGAIRKGF